MHIIFVMFYLFVCLIIFVAFIVYLLKKPFYGIIIRMQGEHGGKHNVPNIHAICGDKESVFSLE